MFKNLVKYLSVWLCVALLTFGALPSAAFAQTNEISGSVAGQVYDKSSRTAISGVTVSAQRITTNERFLSQATDSRGSYLISPVPAGIYVFYLDYQGIQFPIAERFDVRTGMDFLLESCFQLDLTNQAAELVQDCSSGVYAESQVVSLGPHRMYRPLPNPLTQEVAETDQAGLIVDHAGVDCIAEDQHSMLSSVIQPEDQVQSARIYFRAAQHPDFYYVVMQQGLMTEAGTVTQPDGEIFTGILPIPGPETEKVIYYLEAVDPNFNMAQSQEHDPDVTDLDNCKRRDPGAAYYTGQDPGIIVGATVAGASAVPVGFQAAGNG